MSTEVAGSTRNDETATLARLRAQVIAQARELALLRWEISLLARQQPVSGRLAKAKLSFGRRFPRIAGKISVGRRAVRASFRSLRGWRSWLPSIGGPGRLNSSPKFRPPLLLVGDDFFAGRIVLDIIDAPKFLLLSPGAGPRRSLPVPQVDEPPLRPPTEGSLVKWLADSAGELRHIGTIIVDDQDELSLGLLRGRLVKGQTLILASVGGQTQSKIPAMAELGEPDNDDTAFRAYTKFPVAWLDPLDEQYRPISAIADRLTWPKISVVMVSFNQASFLEEGILSVLGQNYPNLEFIVVDGNSTDGSIEILNRYRSRVADMIIEPDRGQSDGLNKGFARATGEILTWVNSDDLLEPGALFRVAQAFSTYGVDIVTGGCRQIGRSRDEILVNHHNRLPYGSPIAMPLGLLLEMDRYWLPGCFFFQPEVFFTRDIWNRSGGRLRTDLYYILDYDLWVRMAAAGASVVHIPDFLACSRTHEQQKTTAGMPYLPEVQSLLEEYSSRLLGAAPDGIWQKRLG